MFLKKSSFSKYPIITNRLILLFSIFLLFITCQKDAKVKTSDSYYIPKDAHIVLKINDLETLKSLVRDNDLLKELKDLDIVAYFKKLQVLQNSSNTEALLSFVPVGKNNYEYVYASKLDPVLLEKDSLQKKTNKRIPYARHTIYYIQNGKDSFFAVEKDSMLIASSSQLLIENSIRDQKNYISPDLEKAMSVANTENALSILVNGQQLPIISQYLLPNRKFSDPKAFSSWVSLDITMNQRSIVFDGVATEKDSIPTVLGLLKNTVPEINEISRIAPANASFVTSFTYDDYQNIRTNFANYQDRDIQNYPEELDEMMTGVSEFGEIGTEKENVLVFKSIATENTITTLNGLKVKVYRDYPIYSFKDKITLLKSLQPLHSLDEVFYFTIIEDFVIFAKNMTPLQMVIANFVNKTSFAESSFYQKMMAQLTDASSLLFMSKTEYLKNKLSEEVMTDYQKKLQTLKLPEYPMVALQFVKEDKYTHIHGLISKNIDNTATSSVTQSSSTTLDAALLNNPSLVYNHRTKGKDIVVQDVNNMLYLISSKGTIYWKKQLDLPVLGEIQQIDIYKNGRYQLLFATQNQVYLLDRNGKDVAPYPKRFKDPITQPLALFDYDKNKRYRIVVTQGSKISMFDAKGDIVSGFRFKEAAAALKNKPQHIRIGSKDYILLSQENGKLTILDRLGRPRVTVKDTINFSDKSWYQYQNSFTSLTEDSKVVQIGTNGSVRLEDKELSDNSFIAATNKTLVTFSDNILKIKGTEVELEFGVFTQPKIFYIHNKIYVSTTDMQSHQVFLFDSNGKSIPNFPVYGNSKIDLGNIDADANLEFVVKGEDNSILIYQMN